jgi:hypothetical protein
VTLEEAIEQRQRDDQAINEAVGGRIGWDRSLEGEPAITNQIIADPRPQHMKGFQAFRPTTVQVDVWGRDAGVVRTLREHLIKVLILPAQVGTDQTGIVRFQRAMIGNIRSSPEVQQGQTAQRARTEMFRESIDFIFNHDA